MKSIFCSTQKPRSKLGASPPNPSSAPAKIQTSRVPNWNSPKGCEPNGSGSNHLGAPDEVVALLHGEAAASKQPQESKGTGTSNLQQQRSLPQSTEIVRKGQGAGRSGRQNRVVFHTGWLSGLGKVTKPFFDGFPELEALQLWAK